MPQCADIMNIVACYGSSVRSAVSIPTNDKVASMTNDEHCEINVDFNSDQIELIKIAAGMCNQPIAEFIVDAALDKAVKTILTDKVTFMSDEAYQTVCRTILQSEC